MYELKNENNVRRPRLTRDIGATHTEKMDALADFIEELEHEIRQLETEIVNYIAREVNHWRPLLAAVKECPWFTDWMDALEEERAKERCIEAVAACEEAS